MSGYLFLAAMCVETACVLNIINTPPRLWLTSLPQTRRVVPDRRDGLTSLNDPDQSYYLVSVLLILRYVNDGMMRHSYVYGDLFNFFLCYDRVSHVTAFARQSEALARRSG